jgi:hypothetical protein
VVQDQLRVSEGWVRCGRCAEVFDAREQLFDIDREAPPPWPAAAPDIELPAEAEQMAHADAVAEAPQRTDDVTWAMPREDSHTRSEAANQESDEQDAHVELEPDLPQTPPSASHAARPAGRREPYWVDDSGPEESPTHVISTTPIAALAEPDASASAVTGSPAAPVAAPPAATPSTPAEPATEPLATAGFLRQAEVASRWQRPLVRASLALGVLLLTGILSVQLTWQFRDALQALFPQTTPLLQAFCATTGCELKAWRRIDALTVENSALTVAGNGNNYKLRISLHNKAAYAVALPWVDLSLTDSNGAVVARRMLPPTDFNLTAASLGGNAEETLQIVFSTGAQRVSGYSIEIFHP